MVGSAHPSPSFLSSVYNQAAEPQQCMSYSAPKTFIAFPLAACRLIKDFEREARMEGMPVATLAAKKKGLVQELNGFIAQKKAISEQAESMAELVGTSGGRNGATGPKTKESLPFVAPSVIPVLPC